MNMIHSTTVDWDGSGILIIGDSGSGKSDLALRIIEAGGRLVSDDQTQINESNGKLYASSAPNIEGKIEIRGVGIRDVKYKGKTNIVLAIELVSKPADLRVIVPSEEQN